MVVHNEIEENFVNDILNTELNSIFLWPLSNYALLPIKHFCPENDSFYIRIERIFLK